MFDDSFALLYVTLNPSSLYLRLLCVHVRQYLIYFDEQGCEVCIFMYRYMKGGVASGFNHVEQKVTQRLLQIKGRHHVRCEEVEKLWSSFNDGDVFILDLGKVQYVWMGKESSRTERIKVRHCTA